MAVDKSMQTKRMEIPNFEGVNALVASHVSKKTEFRHAENARSEEIGSVEKRNGTLLIGQDQTATNNHALIYFENDMADNDGLYKITKTGAGTRLYYYKPSTQLWTSVLVTDDSEKDWTIAENKLFVVNGYNGNRPYFVDEDGTTVMHSNDSSLENHLFRAPYASKINYYKDRLYLGDYDYGSNRVKNGIAVSSYPLGILALADGDHSSSTGQTFEVTDTTYFRGDGLDQVDVYRGNSYIQTLHVTGKTETSITCSLVGWTQDIKSADELWVKDTFGDKPKIFRWPDTFGGKWPKEQKEYDTFKLSGEQNGEITMIANVGDVMAYANRENMGIWNNHYPKALDLGIGCSSRNGYVKCLGTLWFIDYNGIYATTGGVPKLMSAKVEPYIKGATRAGLEAASAGKKGFSVFFAIGDVNLYHTDGALKRVLPNVVLEFNLRQENWFVHTGIDAQQFITYKDDDNAELLAYNDGGLAGYNTYEFLSKDVYLDAHPDGAKEIPFRIETDNITLAQGFEFISFPTEIIVECTRGSASQIFVSLDNAPFYRIPGDIAKGCTTLETGRRETTAVETQASCRSMRISIRDYTRKLCKFSRMAINFIETRETHDQIDDRNENT